MIDTLCGYGGTGGGNFGTCTPLSALFKYIGDFSMGLMVPVLAGYIAYSIADRPGLAVGFTGGLLAANGNAVLAKYVFANEVLVDFQNSFQILPLLEKMVEIPYPDSLVVLQPALWQDLSY